MPDIGHDLAAMFEFFQSYDVVAEARDVANLRSIHASLMSFEDWLRETGWDGSPQEVQKRRVQIAGRHVGDAA